MDKLCVQACVHDLLLTNINFDEGKGRAMFTFMCEKCKFEYIVNSKYVPPNNLNSGKDLRYMGRG